MTLLSAKGRIDFEPEDRTRKHQSQSSWKKTAMILTGDDLCHYYAWLLRRRFNLTLNQPLRGSHVSFISDRVDFDRYHQARELFHNKEISFDYDIDPRSNGEHWWLKVFCPEAEAIRVVAGLEPKPFFSFHLTLGYANDKNLRHSHYILDQRKFFNI